MTPMEQKDFLKGYADAEEKLLDTSFNSTKALASLAYAVEPYEQGFRMCLQEDHDRLNVLYANKTRRFK
jgi:hypothetical protein